MLIHSYVSNVRGNYVYWRKKKNCGNEIYTHNPIEANSVTNPLFKRFCIQVNVLIEYYYLNKYKSETDIPFVLLLYTREIPDKPEIRKKKKQIFKTNWII